MRSSATIKQITFFDGTQINLSNNDFIIVVGPNNVGKSLFISELFEKLNNANSPTKIVNSIVIEKKGSVGDLLDDLMSLSQKTQDSTSKDDYQFTGFNYMTLSRFVSGIWNNPLTLQNLTNFFSILVKTQGRLEIVSPPPNIPITTTAPSHPIHVLQKNENIEEKVSSYFKQAFGLDLIVHRNAGNIVPLYVGTKPIIPNGKDRISLEYLQEIEKLPLLHEQGDGIKAFAGILLFNFAFERTMLFIDEPEAFLHPPQAYLLGNMFGLESKANCQYFISTHSSDFLRGILNSNNDRVRIIRIERKNDTNIIHELNRDTVIQIWKDPILRFSNTFDALYHEETVICEGDADCRFYSFILDSVFRSNIQKRPNVFFTHCGGKHRMPTIVKSLIALNVKVKVVCDFDILNDESSIEKIVESLGGDWKQYKDSYLAVKKAIEQIKPQLATKDAKTEIEGIFDSITDDSFPETARTQIREIINKTSAWALAKKIGEGFIPSGDATNIYAELKEGFSTLGLYIVPVGEVECFDKNCPSHGPKWVNEVVIKDVDSSQFDNAKNFIKNLFKNLL
jgi:hypothetical protein